LNRLQSQPRLATSAKFAVAVAPSAFGNVNEDIGKTSCSGRNILDDHVDVDICICDCLEDSSSNTGAIRYSDNRDLCFTLIVRDARDDCLLPCAPPSG
jgi:hypothetical protein